MAMRDLREQLTRDEGYRQHPYRDSVGKLTIGYGRNLEARGISEAEAETLLGNDIADTYRECEATIPFWSRLSDARQGVLVNLCFNCGLNGLLTFRNMLVAMDDQDWEMAARELLDSKYETQVGARAHRLAEQLRTDRWV